MKGLRGRGNGLLSVLCVGGQVVTLNSNKNKAYSCIQPAGLSPVKMNQRWRSAGFKCRVPQIGGPAEEAGLVSRALKIPLDLKCHFRRIHGATGRHHGLNREECSAALTALIHLLETGDFFHTVGHPFLHLQLPHTAAGQTWRAALRRL